VTALAFTPDPPVTAVGVVVPARDEQERIGRCLRSLRRALAYVPDGVDIAVAVVLDRCTDATPQRVAAALSDWPEATILTVQDDESGPCPTIGRAGSVGRPRGGGVGALRDLGLRALLDRLSDIPRPGSGC
jgi:hypothetical protein